MSATPVQLALGVRLNDQATFANFYTPPDSANAATLALLKQQACGQGEPLVFLWGAPGVGLTHLLQASCHEAESAGQRVQYLPLHDLAGYAPEQLLEGLEAQDLVCLDGLDAVAGQVHWERALFHFFNALRQRDASLLISAHASPRELPLELADLRSRLQWGVTAQIAPLTDADKQRALQTRARARGMHLGEEVAQFIVQRVPRDMNELFCYLHRLDDVSLAEQRKLTIPFVKKVLGI